MWKIKSIREADFGCEERMPGQKLQCLVTLEDKMGNQRNFEVADEWLTENNLDEGGRWYDFWGWEKANISAVTEEYKGICTPKDLYDALCKVWCEATCAPRLREKWSRENITLGQCSITAFLAQDIFGGKVYGILRNGGDYHCYNVVGDCVFDLTSEQFHGEVLSYENNPEQFREIHFEKEEKMMRYEYLKKSLKNLCKTS